VFEPVLTTMANTTPDHGMGDHRNLATTQDDEGQRLDRIEYRAAWPAPDGAAMGGC
jgi:hypothetical protein